MFFMQAIVLEVQWGRLLVLDLDTRQRVLVNTPMAQFFRPGDQVNIWYDGAMTRSIPPQISARHITKTPSDDYVPLPPPVRPPQPRPPRPRPPQPRPPVFFPPVFRPPMGRPPWRRGSGD